MPSQASINFSEAHARFSKAADKTPEWFDRANDAYAATGDGKKLLLHAIMDALKEAYDAGRSGKGLPPLHIVEPHATRAAAAKAAGRQSSAEPQQAATTKPGRVSRTPPATPAPAVPKRITRGAR